MAKMIKKMLKSYTFLSLVIGLLLCYFGSGAKISFIRKRYIDS
ncbi:hypothetical protein [Bacillus sp. FSL H8-0545]